MSFENTTVRDELVIEALERKYQDLGGTERRAWILVAKSLGVYPSYISGIRSGRRMPSPTFVRKLGLRRVISFERIGDGRA